MICFLFLCDILNYFGIMIAAKSAAKSESLLNNGIGSLK